MGVVATCAPPLPVVKPLGIKLPDKACDCHFHIFDKVSNRQIVASIYMLNDPRYIVADPRSTISVLHILPSHTFEYRPREHWKKYLLEPRYSSLYASSAKYL